MIDGVVAVGRCISERLEMNDECPEGVGISSVGRRRRAVGDGWAGIPADDSRRRERAR
jgi:hypothetical protein